MSKPRLSLLVKFGLPISRCGIPWVANSISFTRFNPHRHLEYEINFVAHGFDKVIVFGGSGHE